MRFEVQAGRVRHTIEVHRSGTGWSVTVDGRVMEADLARAGSRWSLLLRSATTRSDHQGVVGPGVENAASSHEITIEARGGRQWVHVDGRAVPVTIVDPRNRRGKDREGSTSNASGPVSVASPMPGRVIKVLVAQGDEVTARQGLVVIEAMKMENELRAPRAGRVTDIRVREGAAVEANTVLVTLS